MNEWRTYRTGWHERSPLPTWIDAMPSQRIRNLLSREVARLRRLVISGVFFDPERTPIPNDQLEDYRRDLESWNDPEAVLRLLRDGMGWIYIRNMGKKTRQQVIEALEELVSQ